MLINGPFQPIQSIAVDPSSRIVQSNDKRRLIFSPGEAPLPQFVYFAQIGRKSGSFISLPHLSDFFPAKYAFKGPGFFKGAESLSGLVYLPQNLAKKIVGQAVARIHGKRLLELLLRPIKLSLEPKLNRKIETDPNRERV